MPEYADDIEPVRPTSLERISAAMPAQWRGETSDGRSLYVRYRHGWLEAGLGVDFDEAVDASGALDDSVPLYRAKIGGDHDGEIAEDDMLRQLAEVVLDGRQDSPAQGA